MAQQQASGRPKDRQSERRNPPSSVVNRRVRSLALVVFLGGILALFTIIWIGALVMRASDPDPEAAQVETAESESEPLSSPAHTRRPGGFDPGHTPSTTRDELEQRGVGVSIEGPMPPLLATPPVTSLIEIVEGSPAELAGRRLELEDVEVETHEGNILWVRDDLARMPIVTPVGLPAIEAGTRVEIGGVIEAADPEAMRVRATRVDVIEESRGE